MREFFKGFAEGFFKWSGPVAWVTSLYALYRIDVIERLLEPIKALLEHMAIHR
jgi:hypothetical protein